jgi:TRAP-type C4-dicarboxylate transport system substrate-binding protein
MKRLLLALVLIVLLVAIAAEGCAQPTSTPAPAPKPAEAIKWQLQTGMPLTDPFVAVYCKAFMERVKEKGKGGLEIQLLGLGEVLAKPQLFQGVMDGRVEMGGSSGLVHASLLPEARIEFGLPYSLATNDQFYDFYYKYKDGAFLKTLNEAYREKGTQLLALAGVVVDIMTKFPINKADDLRGKRIIPGNAGQTGGPTPWGFTIVPKPDSEMYAALQTGAADGIIGPQDNIIGLKLPEVTSYISFPPYAWGANDLYCNLAAFNKLPPELQKAVQEAAAEAALNVYGPESPAREAAFIESGKKAGMTVITLPDEEVAKLRAMAVPMWDGMGRTTPRCAALVDMVKSYLREKGMLK